MYVSLCFSPSLCHLHDHTIHVVLCLAFFTNNFSWSLFCHLSISLSLPIINLLSISSQSIYNGCIVFHFMNTFIYLVSFLLIFGLFYLWLKWLLRWMWGACAETGLCFEGSYLLDCWDNWGAFVEAGWEKVKSSMWEQMPSEWLGEVLLCGMWFIFSSTFPGSPQ